MASLTLKNMEFILLEDRLADREHNKALQSVFYTVVFLKYGAPTQESI